MGWNVPVTTMDSSRWGISGLDSCGAGFCAAQGKADSKSAKKASRNSMSLNYQSRWKELSRRRGWAGGPPALQKPTSFDKKKCRPAAGATIGLVAWRLRQHALAGDGDVVAGGVL